MKCCGRSRATKYCPECGKCLVHVLDGLLRHCKSSLATAERVVKHTRKRGEGLLHAQSVQDCSELVRRQERVVAKWQSWVWAIDDALAGREIDS